MAANSQDSYLDALWALLPRDKRPIFYDMVLESKNKNRSDPYFSDSANASLVGRYFAATMRPERNDALSTILQNTAGAKGLSAEVTTSWKRLVGEELRRYLTELDIGGLPNSPATGGSRRRQTRRNRRLRRTSRRHR